MPSEWGLRRSHARFCAGFKHTCNVSARVPPKLPQLAGRQYAVEPFTPSKMHMKNDAAAQPLVGRSANGFASLSRPVLALGLGGLIPFVASALWVWLTPDAAVAQTALTTQHAYAACILSFIGALHWAGASRSAAESDAGFGVLAAPAWRLVWGVMPSLWAWLAWVIPAQPNRGLWLTGGLLAALAFDWATAQRWGWSRGFLYLRTLLTTVASISLVMTTFAIHGA